MGVMSRRVLPVCSKLCIFCPSMRARSRQPVKRYKKLLAHIFPRSQNAEPNDRAIGKLCEYASKNPLRIPKITDYLEQRFYKDLRNEHYGSVKVVLLIYRKLLSSCKEQMPLFASSYLGIIRTLLEETREDDMQIMGCSTLVDFINCQMDSTHMFNLEGLIPKLCQLAQEVGDDERALRLRSSGLQVLASMVRLMGEQSHISMDFDNIISVTLENYVDLSMNPENSKQDRQYSQQQEQWVDGVLKVEDQGSPPDITKTVTKTELVSILDASQSPSYWSRVCLHNIAQLAKEVTTVRRVLEPLFHTFDTEDHWSPEKGLAFSVLTYLQSLMEESGGNSHLLLSILVKHLEHKNVVKQPVVLMNIVNVATQLAQNVKQQASVAIISAISDLMKHLRKCVQYSSEASCPRVDLDKQNIDLQYALEKGISQFSNKVGDVGPILDMMSVVLENIPMSAVVARTTIYAVHRTAQIIASIPNISYDKKAFPDALFHHLLLAMAHPDNETRVGAHRVFSTVLMPSLVCPWSVRNDAKSEALSCFLPLTSQKEYKPEPIGGARDGESQVLDQHENQSTKHPARIQSYNFKHASTDGKAVSSSLRLSSHQVSLLLSLIWVQATSTENTPANYEAMVHTYNLALLFTLSKNSSHVALARCFQLAFSLRSISLDQEGGLKPSRRRSLFTLASSMLIFSARAGCLPELIPIVKSTLTSETVDPYLELVEDIQLQAVHIQPDGEQKGYGSQDDEVAALKSLSAIELGDQQLKETIISHFMTVCGKLSEDELLSIKKQLLQGFSPDDAYPLGAPLFMETPHPCSPLAQMEFQAFDEAMMLPDALTDEEAFPDPNGSQSGRKESLSITSLDVLSVNQLLESVLETARQVASFPISSTPVPYDQVKNQCEALVTGKQQKMSVLHSFKLQQDAKAIIFSSDNEKKISLLANTTMELSEVVPKLTSMEPSEGKDLVLLSSRECVQQSFRLPPSSPYDKFLKAAGC